MSSEKQLIANQTNARLSTGPQTDNGKAIVSTNAIKHGIFTKDLIISSTLGHEDETEYLEMLSNLIDCLCPQNQMESLLVEKIALDFWCLRRVIRFESGSIRKYLETLFNDTYSYGKKSNSEIEKKIEEKNQYIEWVTTYLPCLENGEVTFDLPTWHGKDIESDILDDFNLIAKTLDTLSNEEREALYYGAIEFAEMKSILKQNGYSSKKVITEKLLELYDRKLHRLREEIEELEQTNLANIDTDKLNTQLGAIPQADNTDKILKYERSIQKSIFQNLCLLKQLQQSS